MIWRTAALVAAALVSVWAIARFAHRPFRCNADISVLEARTLAAAQTASSYDRLRRARQNLVDLARLRVDCPTEVRVPMMVGTNKEMVGATREALQSYREALRIDQRPEIYVAIAMQQIQLGRVEDAVESYVTAIRFAPYIEDEIASMEIRERVQERLRWMRSPSAK